MTRSLIAVVACLGAAALVACGPQEPVTTPSTTAAPTTTTPAAPPAGLRVVLDLDFDQPGGAGALGEGAVVPSAGGGPDAAVRLAGEPPVEPVVEDGAEGSGLRLAIPCDPQAACPKAVLEVADSPDLVPGTRDFRYGASVLMQPDETSKGSNVVQKGFNNGGASQWKLQVDGEKGHPSCVLVGTDPAHDWLVTAEVDVADGTWHTVECRREGGTLAVVVDGEVDRTEEIDPATDVSPASPVRIGGKSLKPDNDQYFGVLDDVFFLLADS